MEYLAEVTFQGYTYIRIDIYAKRNNLKLKIIERMISERLFEVLGYCGNRYIKQGSSKTGTNKKKNNVKYAIPHITRI